MEKDMEKDISIRDYWIVAFGYPPEELYLGIPWDIPSEQIDKLAEYIAKAKMAKRGK